ncbi:MAG: hypothetical protein ACYC8T_32915 [Myxococcaceae bacterium]
MTAAIGAALGFAVESVHQWAGVWVLPDGAAVPWWIAPLYFAGLLAVGAGLRALEAKAAVPLRPTRREVIVEALLAGVLVAAPVFLHRQEALLAALAVGWLAARLALRRHPWDLAVAAAVAAIDAGVELALIHGSLFHYATAAWMPVPLWLAPLWASLALSLRRLFPQASS